MDGSETRPLRTGVPYDGRTYFCSLELALELIGGKWKMMFLYQLRNGPLRSAELRRRMRGISAKMFTQTARSLEKARLVGREIYPVVPPKVEYFLTGAGESAIPLIMQMGYWGEAVSDADAARTGCCALKGEAGLCRPDAD